MWSFLKRGARGDAGATGAQGSQGDAGAKGDQGDKGDTGDTGAAGTFNYTDRGDVDAFDYEMGVLTEDGAYHALDISGVVGVGVRLVLLHVSMGATTAGKTCSFRTNGVSTTFNTGKLCTQINGNSISGDLWVLTDASGVIEYAFASATWSFIRIVIRGWCVA